MQSVLMINAAIIFALFVAGYFYFKKIKQAIIASGARIEKLSHALHIARHIAGQDPSPICQIDNEGKLFFANEASLPWLTDWGIDLKSKIPDDWFSNAQKAFNTERIVEEIKIVGARTYVVKFIALKGPSRINIYGEDITDKVEAQEQVKTLAYYDQITHLPNQRLFQDHLAFEIQHASHLPKLIVVILISVNDFKEISATYNAEVGYQFLQELAKRLNNMLREGAILARHGENEFSILEAEFNYISEIVSYVYALKEALSAPFLRGKDLALMTAIFSGFSFGVAVFPNDSDNYNSLMTCAASALQTCIKNRSDYEFYQEGVNRQVQAQRSLLIDLQEAVKNRHFTLAFQPQIDIQTNKVIGAEVLIRWFHPVRGNVPPYVFIPAAEEAGLIPQIDEWVFETACRHAKIWQEKNIKIKLAINISAVQFSHPKLVEKIKETLEKTNVSPSLLEIEITETAVMLEVQKAIQTMKAIKQLGLSLAIDDFGTGYSSLGYLRHFPVDKLKIEGSFISDIANVESAASLTKGIIDLGHGLKLKVLAEAVETEEQLKFLKHNKCDYVQGYFYSKPLPAEEFEKFLLNFI